MTSERHTSFSSYREMMIEHVFLGELLRHFWQRDIFQLEVLKSQVDDSGYDLIIEHAGTVRHIQLKASFSGSKTNRVPINVKLSTKPSGCIIWVIFQEKDLSIKELLWFGAEPGKELPSINSFPIAQHTRLNASGIRPYRQNIRNIPKSAFIRFLNIADLAEKLFNLT